MPREPLATRDRPGEVPDPLAAARAELGRRQAAVVAALVAGAQPPPGFAPDGLAYAGEVVAHKQPPAGNGRVARLWRWMRRS